MLREIVKFVGWAGLIYASSIAALAMLDALLPKLTSTPLALVVCLIVAVLYSLAIVAVTWWVYDYEWH